MENTRVLGIFPGALVAGCSAGTDPVHLGAVEGDGVHLAAVGVGIVDKAVELDAGPSAVGSKGVARVAAGGVGNLRDPSVLEHRHLDGVPTVLEGTRGVKVLHLGAHVGKTQGLSHPRERDHGCIALPHGY